MSEIPQIESYLMPISSQLPANIVNWKIDPKRAVLLVHDMQDYFIRRIPSEYPRKALIRNIAMLIERCRKFNVPIAFTLQPGNMTPSQRGLLNDFWGPGMKTDPNDRRIVDELTPQPEDWLFTKWRYSAFYRSDLLKCMQEAERDQLVICGVYAHIGVLMTAVEAFTNDIKTFLIGDAVADFSEVKHLMALNYAARCCAAITLANEVMV